MGKHQMTKETQKEPTKTGLSQDRVIAGAVTLADRIGINPLTIRKLADELGVKPMTIYHYVPNKEEIVDGMVDWVFSQVTLPPEDVEWREALVIRTRSMHEVLVRHHWAPPIIDSRRTPGRASLRHYNAMIGCLRGAGLSISQTADAYAALDSYVYGFALQEVTLPSTGGDELSEIAEEIAAPPDFSQYPHLLELITDHATQPGYDFANSFEVGLGWILDAVEDLST